MIPPELVPSLPAPVKEEPKPVLDPQWDWVMNARAESRPFSTFAEGTEPDTWPPLEEEPISFLWLLVAIPLLLILWLWNKEMNRLHIKRKEKIMFKTRK